MEQQYNKYVIYSVLLHLLALVVLVVSITFKGERPVVQNSAQNEAIEAVVMEMPAPAKIISEPSLPKPTVPPRVIPVIKPRPAEIKKEVIPIAEKKQKKILPKKEIEKELLTDLKNQTLQQKKIKQKAIEAAFAKEIKELNAKSLQQQVLREKNHLAAMHSQQVHGVVDKYKALILQTISQHWILPGKMDKTLFAELLIRVAPGGTVLEAQIIKSSGNEALDRSACTAVFKSSPLPVPNDSDAFESFRQFVLKVKPENVLADDSWMS